jgi:DNA-directed RNA polymerase alpha subunit
MDLVAKKNIGKMHAKWSPVSTCVMRKVPMVKLNEGRLNKELTEDQRREFVKSCPRKVFCFNTQKKAIEIENEQNCSLCQECVKYSDDH